jgi:hypothetical protein
MLHPRLAKAQVIIEANAIDDWDGEHLAAEFDLRRYAKSLKLAEFVQ